jgi:hypothetical protein
MSSPLGAVVAREAAASSRALGLGGSAWALPAAGSPSLAWWATLTALACVTFAAAAYALLDTGRIVRRGDADGAPAWSQRYARAMRLVRFFSLLARAPDVAQAV